VNQIPEMASYGPKLGSGTPFKRGLIGQLTLQTNSGEPFRNLLHEHFASPVAVLVANFSYEIWFKTSAPLDSRQSDGL
jgi:hypothetical protein